MSRTEAQLGEGILGSGLVAIAVSVHPLIMSLGYTVFGFPLARVIERFVVEVRGSAPWVVGTLHILGKGSVH